MRSPERPTGGAAVINITQRRASEHFQRRRRRCPIIRSPPEKSLTPADNLPAIIRPAWQPNFYRQTVGGGDFSERRSYNGKAFYGVGDLFTRGDVSNPWLSLPGRIFHRRYVSMWHWPAKRPTKDALWDPICFRPTDRLTDLIAGPRRGLPTIWSASGVAEPLGADRMCWAQVVGQRAPPRPHPTAAQTFRPLLVPSPFHCNPIYCAFR